MDENVIRDEPSRVFWACLGLAGWGLLLQNPPEVSEMLRLAARVRTAVCQGAAGSPTCHRLSPTSASVLCYRGKQPLLSTRTWGSGRV